MLSNTAIPKYYGRFREDVMAGRTPICATIEMEMQRIDALIANPGVYYDEDKVEGFIAFCEGEMTLTDGRDMKLLDSFKLWAEQVLGWWYYEINEVPVPLQNGGVRYEERRVLKRLTNKQYLIVARGAAKTMYAAGIQDYFLNVDTTTTHQIAVAFTLRQADETLSPIRTAITRAPGPLMKFLTEGSLQNTTGNRADRMKLASTKVGIQNFLTNSYIEAVPMSIDKLQSMRTKIATVDEWLSTDVKENVIGAIEQGASKIDDYLIVAISSEGTVRNGVGDSIKMELMKILRGEMDAPWVSIWWYQLDDEKEIGRPDLWRKANPNIGLTVSYETYQRDVDKMEKNPDEKNDIMAKRFGIPCEGQTYFFTYDETLPHRKQNFTGMACAMGADLSMGDDFCSFGFLFPLRGGAFGYKNRSYISQLTYDQLPIATRNKYQTFMREGSLVVMDGTVLDMMAVYDDLDQHIIDMEYDVRCFGYDPYNAQDFVARWQTENGPFGIEKVIQGARTESVPLGELKKLASERLILFDEELVKYAMGNCIAIRDTNNNKKLYKKRREQKIDAVAAMMDAYIAWKVNREAFE